MSAFDLSHHLPPRLLPDDFATRRANIVVPGFDTRFSRFNVSPMNPASASAESLEGRVNTLYTTALGLIVAAGSCASVAQQSAGSIDFQPRAQPQMHPAFPAEGSLSIPSTSDVHERLSTAVSESLHPVASTRIVDKMFVIANGLHIGMAIYDVEMTQRCIANHSCQEGNPFMPSSRAGQLALVSSLVAFDFGASYQMKKYKMKLWWLAPSTGLITHTAGVITGIMHQ